MRALVWVAALVAVLAMVVIWWKRKHHAAPIARPLRQPQPTRPILDPTIVVASAEAPAGTTTATWSDRVIRFRVGDAS